ncbi:hypothetical protein [Pseudoalteromonas lipolytica]|uniref:Uncharacterized protein n=1 Tax=Pseudoalteromonas lipolytica TaxID=570156 RepID=A0ABU8SYR6_9GAMM
MSSTLSKLIVKISSGNSKRTVDEQVNVGYQFILFVLFICFGASLYLIANAATLIILFRLVVPALICGYIAKCIIDVLRGGKAAKLEASKELAAMRTGENS